MSDEMRFRIIGLDCADEVVILERAIGPLVSGREALAFDLLEGVMTVRGRIAPRTVLQAVAATGMRGQLISNAGDSGSLALHDDRRSRALVTLCSALSTAGAFSYHAIRAGSIASAFGSEGVSGAAPVPLVARLLYLVAIALGTWFVLPRAWRAARDLRPDMNLLMVVAIAGALVLGEWFEGASVASLFAVSLWLEAWSVGRARRAIGALLDLSPMVAWVRTPGGETETPVGVVAVGAVVVVRPGERIPIDGVVVAGRSEVNQAPISGESVPVAKGPGDALYAGTVNGIGALEMRTTRRFEDSTVARISRLIRDARAARGVTEEWVDRFARRYTPTVMALAVVLAVAPPLFGLGAWGDWIYRALVLLVIACPCALVISTPVAIVAGLTAAAREGVLIKGGRFLEAAARLRAVAFDKTGTLTEGRLEVDAVLPRDGVAEVEVLFLAAAVECRSTHPLAQAVLAYARQRAVDVQPAEDAVTIAGRGATGRVRGEECWVGSVSLMRERFDTDPAELEWAEGLLRNGKSVVVVGGVRGVRGAILLADRARAEARSSIERLRELGIREIVMLTGDNSVTAEVVGQKVGVTKIESELMPEEKVIAIRNLTQRAGETAMIGDGVNDAPAMAAATIGIAMGSIGSDVAIETADIALMSDDLRKLPWLIAHARRALRLIRQNIAIALVTKLAVLGLTLSGHSSLWAAIAADMGASLIVILNALRLLDANASRSGVAE